MKRRVLLSFTIFCFFIIIFLIQKIIFILVHGSVNGGIDIADTLRVIYHGLPLDMSMSGYLTAIPLLLLTASVWWKSKSFVRTFNIYFGVMLSIVAIITITDVGLYSYWKFHVDSTVLLYLQNPKEVLASASVAEWVIRTLCTVVYAVLIYFFYFFTVRKILLRIDAPHFKIVTFIVLIFLTGTLFLPIRGGVTVSTMNVSYAYFSDRMFLNHSAINPVFNFMYSLKKPDDFSKQYQFYEREEAEKIFSRMREYPKSDSIPQVLKTDKPNIILFMLESFSYDVALDSVVAPNMSRFAKEGILFENFYANGYRTDRGIVSILSGYPSHPTAAILKYPKKTESLSAIPKSLRQAGYGNQSMYYGGDVNFANMRSYFVGSCGIKDVVSDKDFPIKERLTKWGVPDRPLLERVFRDLTESTPQEPFLKVILTLSSHEPFDVPVTTFDEPFLNSVNYTDECLGNFVSGLKEAGLWENMLIIFLADHATQGYPKGANNNEKIRFKIPMIWIGGAIKQPLVVSDFGSQNDLSATLLSQLRIDHSDFEFSKDIFDPNGPKFSFYSYVNGFCMMDSSNVYMYDNNLQKALQQTGDPAMEKQAKAYFQKMYIDFGNR